MFRTIVKEAVKIPGLDYIHIVGVDLIGSARIGDRITDGKSDYEITSIPFVRRSGAKSEDEVDICINASELNPSEFVGKTLYAVQ